MYVEKFCANGNTFIIVDKKEFGDDCVKIVQKLCDAKKGLGADGVIVVKRATTPVATIFNADGSIANTCGNGLRCVALWLIRQGYPKEFSILTADKKTPVKVIANSPFKVTVGLGKPIFFQNEQRVLTPVTTKIFVGNGSVYFYKTHIGVPHAVVMEQGAKKYAKQISTHSEFKDGTNVDFVSIKNGKIYVSTYERGVGWTDACGTGACAVGAVCFAKGISDHTATIRFKGGSLSVCNKEGEMYLTGGATRLFGAKIDFNKFNSSKTQINQKDKL